MRQQICAGGACLLLLAAAVAGARPVTVVEPVRILNDHAAEARYYYAKNWQVLREMAAERGFIHSWEIVHVADGPDPGFDLLLITRYVDAAQHALAEERFQALIREYGPLRLMNDVAPGGFRQGLGAHTGLSETSGSIK